jgi:hypothetical protein
MLSQMAVASPMAPMPELDIEGTIASLTWVPEYHEEGMWGMSGSLGGARSFKAAYDAFLVDCKVDYSDKTLTDAEKSFYPEERIGEGKQMSLTLVHPEDDGYLKVGMRIRVVKYNEFGDEGGVWTRHEKIEILDTEKLQPNKTCPLNPK